MSQVLGEVPPLAREHSAHPTLAAAQQAAATLPNGHVARVVTTGTGGAPPPATEPKPRGHGDSMKTFFATLLGTLLGVGLAVGGGVWYLTRSLTPEAQVADRGDFGVQPDEIAADLLGHTVATQGQVWLFTPDQKIAVKVLERRATPQGVQVVVDLTAVVTFPAAPKPVEPIVPKPAETGKGGNVPAAASGAAAAPPSPTKATISGTARLTYERAAGKWFLVSADALNLRITAE